MTASPELIAFLATHEGRCRVERRLSKAFKTDANGCVVSVVANSADYPELKIGGDRISLHRAVVIARGEELLAGVVVRHTCDNPRCVNSEHLVTGTQSQNIRDMYERHREGAGWKVGSERHSAKTTEEVVCEMRRMARTGLSLTSIASIYGMPKGTAASAIRGKTWAHVTSEPPVPRGRSRAGYVAAATSRRVEVIHAALVPKATEMRSQGSSLDQIATSIGLSRATTHRLLSRVAA